MTASTPLSRAVANVEITTLAIGGIGAIYEFATSGWRAAAALAVGTLVSWLNYKWLRSGVTGLVPVPASPVPVNDATGAAPSAEQTGTPSKPSSGRVFLMFTARIVLLLAALYVILSRSLLPSTPLLA